MIEIVLKTIIIIGLSGYLAAIVYAIRKNERYKEKLREKRKKRRELLNSEGRNYYSNSMYRDSF